MPIKRPYALPLIDRGGLVRGQPPGRLQRAGQADDALGLPNSGGQAVELILANDPDLDECSTELVQAGNGRRAAIRGGAVHRRAVGAGPTDPRLALVDRVLTLADISRAISGCSERGWFRLGQLFPGNGNARHRTVSFCSWRTAKMTPAGSRNYSLQLSDKRATGFDESFLSISCVLILLGLGFALLLLRALLNDLG